MNINFELALSRLANDPTDLVAWSVILDAFENKVPNTRTINGINLVNNIILSLASDDFVNQGTTTTVLHGNASGNPSWGAIVASDITNSTITLAKIQDITTNRILGRVTTGSGVTEQLTGTQATTLLDLFSTSATTKGLVPGSNGVANTYFLRADQTWAVPVSTVHSSLSNLTYASSGHTGFEPTITAGTSVQYWRGDKTWQPIADLSTATNNWGDIIGTIGDQTDLMALLNAKAPLASPTFTGTVTGTFAGNVTGNLTGDVVGNVTGTISSTAATAITDDTTTNASMFITWVTANTGNLPQKVSSTKIWFNPSTGTLYTSGDVVAYATP